MDKPIVRKKMAYLEAQVASFVADWVDEGDHSRGIVAREFLPREIAYTAVQMKRDWKPRAYQHHIEPKLEQFGFADTPWLLYLNGYTPISE